MSRDDLGEPREGVTAFEEVPIASTPGEAAKTEPEAGDDVDTPSLADRLRGIIGVVRGLPSDMAEQHDYYLHGQPKR